MSPEKWEEIKDMAKKNFEVLETNRNESDGVITEELIFNGPLGKMKLEFVSKPLVLSKNVHYSKRMGDTAKVDYVTSDTEKTNTLFAYKWETASDTWTEINAASFGE
ncbi:MAG: hypothetical protein NTZ49_02365 [Candidatus Parcubacteria bacterium]|nr:hypothetical protein [Candidatus Parcubacteria bacterium]